MSELVSHNNIPSAGYSHLRGYTICSYESRVVGGCITERVHSEARAFIVEDGEELRRGGTSPDIPFIAKIAGALVRILTKRNPTLCTYCGRDDDHGVCWGT